MVHQLFCDPRLHNDAPTSDEGMKVGERGCSDRGGVGLVGAGKEARPLDHLASGGVLDVDVGVAADVPEDPVHAEQGPAGTDDRVLFVSHGVEERDASALVQDLVVGRSEQTVRQAVSVLMSKEHG